MAGSSNNPVTPRRLIVDLDFDEQPQNIGDFTRDSNTPTNATSEASSRAARKKTSTVWEYFDKFDEQEKAVCKLCRATFKHKRGTGTGTLSRHLANIHGDPSKQTHHQTQLNTGQGQLGGNFKYSHQRTRDGIVEWIIRSEMPFNTSEDPNFETFAQTCLNPQFKRIPRSSNRSNIGSQFLEKKKMLIDTFASTDHKFALTSDTWKAITNEHYICITAHWIDSDWHLQKRIITFQRFEHSHTGSAIVRVLTNAARDFGIHEIFFAISFDNASNNTASIPLLKDQFKPVLDGIFFHNRCACHILNLAVQDGLQLIENVIKPIRDAVVFIRSSSSREQEFKRLCRENGKRFKKFKIDVATRWNSTAHLLESTFEYEHLLIAFYNENIGSNSQYYLCETDFRIAKQMYDILQIVEVATTNLSSSYSPTTHCILPYLVNILYGINSRRHESQLALALEAMEFKLLKYFENFPILYCVATVLDPQLKSSGFDELLELYVQSSSLRVIDRDHLRELTMSTINALFDIYSDILDVTQKDDSQFLHTPSSSASHSNKGKGIMLHNPLLNLPMKRPRFNSSSLGEIVLYEQTPRLSVQDNPDYEILKWWKANAHLYPILSVIARDVLTPPVSTVASESAFSAGGRVLDEYRSRMSQQSVEITVCLKDWFDAEDRKQGLMQELLEETSSGSSTV